MYVWKVMKQINNLENFSREKINPQNNLASKQLNIIRQSLLRRLKWFLVQCFYQKRISEGGSQPTTQVEQIPKYIYIYIAMESYIVSLELTYDGIAICICMHGVIEENNLAIHAYTSICTLVVFSVKQLLHNSIKYP